MFLSETSVKRAAAEMISEYGSQAWGMADMRVRSLKAEGFDSFAATWGRIRDAIGEVQEIGGQGAGLIPDNLGRE